MSLLNYVSYVYRAVSALAPHVSRALCAPSRASCSTCSHNPHATGLACSYALHASRPTSFHDSRASYPMCSCVSHGFCPTGSHASYVSPLTCSDVSLTSYLTCSTVNNSDMQPPLKECYCNVFFSSDINLQDEHFQYIKSAKE